MKKQNVLQTFFSRFFILILTFGLVIFSTNIWGSSGRGAISMLVANVAMVSFFSSIFSGSSASYFAKKFPVSQVLGYSYFWSVLTGILVPVLFAFSAFQPDFTVHFILISVLSSLLATNINLFIGQQNIRLFNLFSVLQQFLHLIFLGALLFLSDPYSVALYFWAQIFALTVLFAASFYQISKKISLSSFRFSRNVFLSMLEYGWKTQLSALIQFLNYRLSFYFLDAMAGLSAVGIFSVGITFAEAIWSITRSVAVVLYAEVVNSKSAAESVLKTKNALKISWFLMIIFVFGILLIPAKIYPLIFGPEFIFTKKIMLLLSPGIVAIGISDMLGYYFSGIKSLKILNVKSFVGLFITLLLSWYAIPKWGFIGAAIVTSVSYCASSALLFAAFFRTHRFYWRDYFISKQELKHILKPFSRK